MIELSPCLAADKLLPQKALGVRLKHLPHHTVAHRGRALHPGGRAVADEVMAHSALG